MMADDYELISVQNAYNVATFWSIKLFYSKIDWTRQMDTLCFILLFSSL